MSNFPPRQQLAQIFRPHREGARPWREGDIRYIGHMATSYGPEALNIVQRLDYGIEQRLIGREITYIGEEKLHSKSVRVPSLSERIISNVNGDVKNVAAVCYQSTLRVIAEFVQANPEIKDVLVDLFDGAKGWQGILMASGFGMAGGEENSQKGNTRRSQPIPSQEFRGQRHGKDFGQCGFMKTANAINVQIQDVLTALNLSKNSDVDISPLFTPAHKVRADFIAISDQLLRKK